MEGAGSRLGRASSRYGQITSSSTVLTGPVRKWKRQWKSGALLLPRWTPLSPDPDSVNHPKRKFRYTPVVQLKQNKGEADKEADVTNDVGMTQLQEITKDISPSTEKNHEMNLFGKHGQDETLRA